MTTDSRSLARYTQDIEEDPVISVPARIVEGWDVGDRHCNLLIRLFDSHIEFRDAGHKIVLGDVDLPLDELIKKRLHMELEPLRSVIFRALLTSALALVIGRIIRVLWP